MGRPCFAVLNHLIHKYPNWSSVLNDFVGHQCFQHPESWPLRVLAGHAEHSGSEAQLVHYLHAYHGAADDPLMSLLLGIHYLTCMPKRGQNSSIMQVLGFLSQYRERRLAGC